MSGSACVDLLHDGLEGSIACYVLPGDEPTLIDPGPSTTLGRLLDELDRLGVGPADLRHILLTHIHLDHAGATGHLAERFPAARVHVHRDGASHLVEPERLVGSTRRTFGEAHDRLWGEVKPVPKDRIHTWEPGGRGPCPGLRALSTPGHIAHHVAYLDERDGTLFSGDAMGVALAGAPPIPPTPPPAIDLVAWRATLDEIGGMDVGRFAATHFGFREDVEACRITMLQRLDALERRVTLGLDEGTDADAHEYAREVYEELAPFLGEDRARLQLDLFSPATDWAGVALYLTRRRRDRA